MPHPSPTVVRSQPSAPDLGGSLLVVEHDASVRATLAAVLRSQGYTVHATGQTSVALAELAEHEVDLVLTDLALNGDGDGLVALDMLRRQAPAAQFIVLASFGALECALSALKAGAYAYLVKPTDVEELCTTVARALEHRRLKRELNGRAAELARAPTPLRALNAMPDAPEGSVSAALRERVADLEAVNAQLRATQEQHERFVAMVAHELKSPLGLVMSYAQLSARPGATTAQIQRYTSEITEAAQRLNRLVEDLRTATRLSTGHFDLRLAPCDLAAAIRTTVEALRTTVTGRRFVYEAPSDLGLVLLDADRILQAVRNLVDNAIKYSGDDGVIEVRLTADAEHLTIDVRDEGVGIPASELARLFQPFVRGPGSSEIPGSGLGLYITRGIARAHGGELRMQNGEGPERARGAVFSLILKRVPGESE